MLETQSCHGGVPQVRGSPRQGKMVIQCDESFKGREHSSGLGNYIAIGNVLSLDWCLGECNEGEEILLKGELILLKI